MSKIKKELIRFLTAGLSAVGTDLLTYYILLSFLSNNFAKAISFFLGTLVAFIINKYWTFERIERSYCEVLKFTLLYSVTLVLNVTTNSLILEYTSFVFLAFYVATGVSTVLNFIGQKWWVFR